MTGHQDGILYIVHDETVIPCEHNHRVILYVSLDKSKAEEFQKKNYTLKIAEIPLDKESQGFKDYGTMKELVN